MRFALFFLQLLGDYFHFRKTYRKFILPMKQAGMIEAAAYPKSLNYQLRNYATVIAAFFGGQLFRLYDQKKSVENTRLMSACFAASAVFDAFFDEKENTKTLKSILRGEITKPESSLEALAINFYKEINAQSKKRGQKIFETALQLFDAQETQNKFQVNFKPKPHTEDTNTLKRSNDAKGGLGALIYRFAITEEITKTEEKCFADLGAMVQYCDDVFDMQRDLKSGQISPVLLKPSFEAMEQELSMRSEACFAQMESLNLQKRRIHAFLYGFRLYTKMTQKKIRTIAKKCKGDIKGIELLDPKVFDIL